MCIPSIQKQINRQHNITCPKPLFPILNFVFNAKQNFPIEKNKTKNNMVSNIPTTISI